MKFAPFLLLEKMKKKVAIIDAEFICGVLDRFPNLACMKMSAYYKKLGYDVDLLFEINEELVKKYEWVFISKTFTDTKFSEYILELPNVYYGGTGFFYDKYENSPILMKEIEHIFPDYNFYTDYITDTKNAKYYKEYSIGFLTRGCSRRCQFCVNKNSKGAIKWSIPSEFIDIKRKNICLLDDNFFICKEWKNIFVDFESYINKHDLKFEFKQGLDARILNEDIIECLMRTRKRYLGDYIFALDDIKDCQSVENGLKLFRKYIKSASTKAYLLCGYESQDVKDIEEVFIRLESLWKYNCFGYLMRYNRGNNVKDKIIRGIYTHLARWINQPGFQRYMTFRVFCNKSGKKASNLFNNFEEQNKNLSKYFDICYTKDSKYFKGEVDIWSMKNFNSEHPEVIKYWNKK